ncbi:MAG: hypothetical protein ACLR2G_05420 [Phascolarctobacterium faecium]
MVTKYVVNEFTIQRVLKATKAGIEKSARTSFQTATHLILKTNL